MSTTEIDWRAKYEAAHEEILERQREIQNLKDKVFRLERWVYHCPTCATEIHVGERCRAGRGIGTCMERAGHEGFHWSDVGAYPAVLVWYGPYQERRCPGRLSLLDWCTKPPGHEGAHNNGRGVTFGDPEEDEPC